MDRLEYLLGIGIASAFGAVIVALIVWGLVALASGY